MTTIPEYDLDELAALEAKATKGEWTTTMESQPGYFTCPLCDGEGEVSALEMDCPPWPVYVQFYGIGEEQNHNARYVQALLAALPAMIADLRELELRREGEWICPRCQLRQDKKIPEAGF